MRLRLSSLLFVLFAVPALAAPVPDWVKESDALAQPMLRISAQFHPEGAGRLGVEGVDDKVIDLGPRFSERHREATEAAIKDLDIKPEKANPLFA